MWTSRAHVSAVWGIKNHCLKIFLIQLVQNNWAKPIIIACRNIIRWSDHFSTLFVYQSKELTPTAVKTQFCHAQLYSNLFTDQFAITGTMTDVQL